MAHPGLCRFAVELHCNGYTVIDGTMSAVALDAAVNDYLRELEAPPIFFGMLEKAVKGYHISYDMVVNGRLLALEISAIGDKPTVQQQPRIGHQPQ